jgi:hypothetical protein
VVTFYQIAAQETTMRGFTALGVILAGLTLGGCTTDPNAPVNQSFPIRQMDRFFDSLGAPPRQDYTHVRGYAPAYPPYDPSYRQSGL